MTEDSSWLAEKLKLSAELFVVGIGLLYATGFLTTFTFFERFGLREMATDFFRLKYLYVGILYFLFPVTIAIPCFTLALLKQQGRVAKKQVAEPETEAQKEPPLRVPFVTILPF